MARFTTVFTLTLIILAGCFLRFYNLTQVPPSLNWDEVSHAYNSLSLLNTGHDQWGQVLPVINFRAYGDYPLAINLYFTAASIFVFGPTDFAVRLPHALAGALVIFGMFMAAYSWKKSRQLAIWAALISAFIPWTVFPSRAIFQSNWALLFMVFGLLFYLRKNSNLTILFWGLSLYAYHNTRIFIPILVAPILPSIAKSRLSKLLLVVLFVPSILSLFSAQSRARSQWVGILDSGAINQIEVARNTSNFPKILTSALYNRVTYFSIKVLSNYVGYFSPQFLFLTGGTQYQYSVPNFGLFPWICLPFFYLGILLFVFKRNWFLLAWLLLAPLPAAVTRDNFAVIRATTMLPVLIICTSYGLAWTTSLLKRKKSLVLVFAFSIFFFYSVSTYFTNYFTNYAATYSSSWQYGYKQVAGYIKANYSKYDQFIITKRYAEPHEFVLWYLGFDSNRLLADPSYKFDYHDSWYWVDGFDKFKFVNDWDMSKVSKTQLHTLVFSSPDHPVSGAKLGQINFLNGDTAFIITAL